MAILFVCDGCGAAVENPAKVGHITRREYCESCKVKAEEFVAAEEKLRRETHERFIDERAFLIAKYAGFLLPDVP